MDHDKINKKIERLRSYVEAYYVIQWLNDNGDFRASLTEPEINQLAISFVAGPSPEEQEKMWKMIRA